MLEPRLVAFIRSEPTINPIISGRIYPGRLPDPPVLPALVYQRVSTVRRAAYDGPVGFVESRFQLDCWGRSYGEARTLADALRQALLGYSGTMGDVEVAIPRQAGDIDMFEEDTGLYRVMTDWVIWHSEET